MTSQPITATAPHGCQAPVTLTVHDNAGTYRIGPLAPAEADAITALLAGPTHAITREQDAGR